MASKQVSEILIKLGIDGLQGLDKLKSSFRELEKSIGPSDATIQRARKSILDFGNAGIRSEQIIRGQLEAFRGLKSQADVNSSTFIKLSEDIKKFELELSGSTAAINKQRAAILRSTAASDGNVDALRKQVDALSRLQRQTRPGSAAFVQLGKDIEKVDQKLVKVRSEAQAFALALGQFPAASMEKQVRQIETLRRTMNTLKITSDEYLNTLQRINLVSTVQATTTGRQQVRAANQMFESSLFERFVSSRAEALPLPATTAGLRQRISEINQELDNVTGYERRRALTVELIELNRQLKNAVIEITTTEELAAMATRQRASAAREILSRSGFGAFSADVRARAAGGAYDPGTQKAMERARNRIVDQEAVQAIEQLYGRWEQAYSEIEGLLERHQVAKAEITAKGARAQNEILDRQHDQSLREQQRRFEEELALFDQNLRQRDQLLQRRTAVKGMLGLEGRELSPLYQGIVDIGTRRAAAEQARMGKTPQQALADIVNVFNSDLDRAGNGFLESERQLREAAIEFAGGSRKVREKFEQIALGKTPAGMFPAPGEDPSAYKQRVEAPSAGFREIIENFARKTDRAGDGFLEAEKKLRQAAIDFAGNSEEVKRAFARIPLGKTPTSMLPGAGEVPSEYISRIRGGFEDVRLPDFASFRKGTTRELQLVRQSLQELRMDLSPLAAGFEATEKRIVRSIRNIDKELERRQLGGRRMSGMQVAQAAGAAVSGGIFGGPEGFLGGAIGGIAGGVGGAFAGAAAGAQVGALRQQLGGFADYAAQIQKMEIALKNAAGGQAEFNQAMAAASAATRDLNVPQDVAIQGMTRLTAAVVGAKGSVSDAELVFNNVTAAIKATGGSAQDVDGAITAMVQVFSKGKVSAEELSGQLGERLPGAVTKFAEANKMSLPELQKALEQGEVGLNELMNFIIQLGEEYSGVANKIASSSQDAGARLTVAYDSMRIGIGKALQPLGAQLQETFARFIRDIAPAVTASAKGIADAFAFFLDNKILSGLAEFALKLGLVTAATVALRAAMTALAGVNIMSWFTGVSSTARITGDVMAASAVKASGFTTAMRGLLGVLRSIAALGAITVAIDVVVRGFARLMAARQALKELNARRDVVGATGPQLTMTAERRYTGAAREKVAEDINKQREYAARLRKEIEEINTQLLVIESMPGAERAPLLTSNLRAQAELKKAQLRDAEEVIKLDLKTFKTREQIQSEYLRGMNERFKSLVEEDGDSKAKSASDKAAREAERARQAMLKQLKAAQDLNFEQKNRLDILRQEEPFAKAFTEFAVRRAEIERRYNDLLAASRSEDEKSNLQQARAAEYKQSSLILQKEINQLTDKAAAPIKETVDRIKERIEYDREYAKLLKKGVTPELAEQLLQIKKAYDESVKALEPAVKAAELAILKAKAEGASATEIQKYREELEKIQKLPGQKKEEGEAAAKEEADRKAREKAAQDQAERLKAMYANIVSTLEDGIVGSLMAGIEALIGGTKSLGDALKEIASGILKDIGQTLLRFAVNLGMRAAFPGAFAAKGAYFSGNQADFAQNSIRPFAMGGIVTKPTFFKYANGGTFGNGVMGEAGPEAIMPLKRGADGKLGVAARLDGAMKRYRATPGSAAAAAQDESASAVGATATMQPIDVRYTVERINSVDYVTADQFQAGLRQAADQGARQGERRALTSLRQNTTTRRKVGI
jgi:tape measure domain-containing protein